MEITDLVGKRVLLKTSGRYAYREEEVTEYKILEVSPSGNWVKLMNLNGNKFWKPITGLSYVETLIDLKAGRK